MNDLVRYRAMESLCRQNAVFRPLDNWRLLAEAEMWHHKAEQELASRFAQREIPLPNGIDAGSLSQNCDPHRLPAA